MSVVGVRIARQVLAGSAVLSVFASGEEARPARCFTTENIGTRNVALPGRYLRSKTDPACWVNDATGATVCAR